MSRRKKNTLPFTINAEGPKAKSNLTILNAIKNVNCVSIRRLQVSTGLSHETISNFISAGTVKKLVELGSSDKETISLKTDPKVFLGAGFNNDKCVITLIGPSGDILDSEIIDIEPINGFKGKKKEVMRLLGILRENSKFRKKPITLCGVAVPERLTQVSEKNAFLLSEGIGRVFNSDVCFCGSVTASGYGEREAGKGTVGEKVLYLHSDVGWGVVFKGEVIVEADSQNRENDSSYLRSWEQFGIVKIAKDLVRKGVGSSLVNMVSGNIDEITLELVLKAAENGDDLAKDLVVRSALALGVRAAYLVNAFELCSVILGGGTGDKIGNFEEFVKESANKFLKKELEGKLNIFGGKMGVKAASLGAANLCVRELFLEV